MTRRTPLLGRGAVLTTTLLLSTALVHGQRPVPPEEPPPAVRPGAWRMAGNVPCVGAWGHIYECPPPSTTVAIRAGRLFDSVGGRILTRQVIIVQGQKIAEVGPEGTVKIPAGTRVLDLSDATVLPGFIDTHTHVFNTRSAENKLTADASMLLAVQNARTNLLAGFTTLRDMDSHANGYQDVELKNAINRSSIDGPRMLVSGRSITGGAAVPGDPYLDFEKGLASIRVQTVEEGVAAIRAVVAAGAEHIKLRPTSGYKFDQQGVPQYSATHRPEVLKAMIDEAHRLGKRTGCHSFGGDGLRDSVLHGCDSIEHGYNLPRSSAA